MKIILVVTDSKGKNLVFSTDALEAYSLDESVKLAKQRQLDSVHAVQTGQGAYRHRTRTPDQVIEEYRFIKSFIHIYLAVFFFVFAD